MRSERSSAIQQRWYRTQGNQCQGAQQPKKKAQSVGTGPITRISFISFFHRGLASPNRQIAEFPPSAYRDQTDAARAVSDKREIPPGHDLFHLLEHRLGPTGNARPPNPGQVPAPADTPGWTPHIFFGPSRDWPIASGPLAVPLRGQWTS